MAALAFGTRALGFNANTTFVRFWVKKMFTLGSNESTHSNVGNPPLRFFERRLLSYGFIKVEEHLP